MAYYIVEIYERSPVSMAPPPANMQYGIIVNSSSRVDKSDDFPQKRNALSYAKRMLKNLGSDNHYAIVSKNYNWNDAMNWERKYELVGSELFGID